MNTLDLAEEDGEVLEIAVDKGLSNIEGETLSVSEFGREVLKSLQAESEA